MQDTHAQSRLDRYFRDYDIYHRTPGNQRTHFLGIPLIVVAVLGLLAAIPFPGVNPGSMEFVRLDFGVIVWAAAFAWYLSLDWKLGVPFGILLLGFYFLGRSLSVWVLVAFFLAGWGFQYLGHLKFEKQSPAFYKNVLHLLVGPFWIFAKLVGYRR